MPQYDVYPAPRSRGYLLDVQTDILGGISTRVVVPLVPERLAPTITRNLNPIVDLDGGRHVMITSTLAAVPAKSLRGPVANLAGRADEVTRALDMLSHGF